MVPKDLKSDSFRFQQLIHHLLSNAINFSDANTEIKLIFTYVSGVIMFKCVDNGIGILEKDAEKIFKPFVTLEEAKDTGCKSAGLGLYVCKNICEALNG